MYASVIVSTYNRRKILQRTINSLLNQTVSREAFEVIVVDDCSSDDTRAYMNHLRELAPSVVYIRHDANRGRVVTRNDGIRAARGDIVIFLDDDNVPDQPFIEAHIRCHEREISQHIAVMGNVRFAPGVVSGRNFARYLQSRYLGCRSPSDRKEIDYSNLPARCLGTGNCSIRHVDLLAAGMLDTCFHLYGGEDVYLGFCLKQLGIRILFGEDARSWHYDDVSILRYKLKIMETAREGLKIILRKSPEYFEGTQLRFLLPVNWKKDSPWRIFLKLCIRAFLNPVTVFLMERWAISTDRRSFLYFGPLYRLLVAGWAVLGIRSDQRPVKLVTYGEEKEDVPPLVET